MGNIQQTDKSHIYLKDEYEKFVRKIKNHENFMLLRYGDGERAIMMGKSVVAQEGWKSCEYTTKLGEDLLQTLDLEENNVYYGISCPCCDRAAYYWYATRINSPNITFANMFVNANYYQFMELIKSLQRDAVVIANKNGHGKPIGGLNVLKYYSIDNDCVKDWEKDGEQLVQTIIQEFGDRNNLLYVVAAGPMTEPILYRLYKNNPNNCYIDVGSALDFYIHGKNCRPYTKAGSRYNDRNCWMFSPEAIDLGVSVVLTAFKKPDALEKQLKAIQKQSLKPKEILLFQDGINEKYMIRFDEELLKQFSDIKISQTNVGVWERFRYAMTAKSKYVCLFDDDTIPGEDWLANCHFNMIFNRGIYGTVGVICREYEKYPKKMIRVGWVNPNKHLTKVDFVGHSWFFEKEWLNYMFEGTDEYWKKYKYAAEDMCLSFKCQQKGIPSYVPPHPPKKTSVWGSNAELGLKYGRMESAISMNPDNCIKFNAAIKDLHQAGWQFLHELDKGYLRKMYLKYKLRKIKSFL